MDSEDLFLHYMLWRHLRARRLLIFCNALSIQGKSKITKLWYKLKPRRERRYLPSSRRHQPARSQGDLSKINVFERTGLFSDQFNELFEQLKHQIQSPRRNLTPQRCVPTSLQPQFRLLLVLQFLRHYPHYSMLASLYGISIAQVSREIAHILPLLRAYLNHIEWPIQWAATECLGCSISGAIDCTSHYRNRVHPHQSDW